MSSVLENAILLKDSALTFKFLQKQPNPLLLLFLTWYQLH